MADPENKLNDILENARQMEKRARSKTLILYSIIFIVLVILVYTASSRFQNSKYEYAALKDTLQYRDDTIQKLVTQKITLINQFDSVKPNVVNNLLEENSKLKTNMEQLSKVNLKLQEANKNHDSVAVFKSLVEDKAALQEKNNLLQKDIQNLKETNLNLKQDNEKLKQQIKKSGPETIIKNEIKQDTVKVRKK